MERALAELLNDPARAAEQAQAGLETVLARHTCAHRVDELLALCAPGLRADRPAARQDTRQTAAE
ncbi:glycosyltransferase family protein [Azospirillum thermophilum]|uniref:glycosyltransferase family protein n=1 Tax=Azospirillum thermophilum TaxID=2202148 RepID=UPI001FE7B50F|nr:glycosyltransferase [Azospirillum thermophilum]